MTSSYPEIQALEKIYQENDIRIKVWDNESLSKQFNYPRVELTLKNQSFILYVDDEYNDFKMGNPLLSLCLILKELEAYEDEDDFLTWCKSQLLEVSDVKVLDYYRGLSKIYLQIEQLLGKIDSQVSNYDFEFNTGAAKELRKGT